MGSFASICKEDGVKIKPDKRAEFEQRIEKLFQIGGMMDTELVQLCGHKIVTLQKTQMKEDGMCFNYNYFEDDFWESAGYSKRSESVWSNKLGWNNFANVILAGYALEELYTDGHAYTTYNGTVIFGGAAVAWINYLFNEEYHIKNYDMWKTFESLYYDEYLDEKEQHWYKEDAKNTAFISECEICAVLEGVSSALEKFSNVEKGSKEEFAYQAMELVVKYVDILGAYLNDAEDIDGYLDELMNSIKVCYERKGTKEIHEGLGETGTKVIECLFLSDAPAFCVKVIAEKFNKDFWELWTIIKDVVKRKTKNIYYLIPMDTNEFLRVFTDDLIPWWSTACGWDLSEQVKAWFGELKSKYEHIIEDEILIENPVKYIVDLLRYADDNYYQIYVFKDFFEETLVHINDKRYMALWKLFESMLYDSELKEAVEVLFVPEGPEHEKKGMHYWENTTKRRLKTSWSITDWNKKNNKARVTLRRYLALLGNVDLRRTVFGF